MLMYTSSQLIILLIVQIKKNPIALHNYVPNVPVSTEATNINMRTLCIEFLKKNIQREKTSVEER